MSGEHADERQDALRQLAWDLEFAHEEGVGRVYNMRIEGDRLFAVVPLGENNAPHHVELKLVRVTAAPKPVEFRGAWVSSEQAERHSYVSSEAYRKHREEMQGAMAEQQERLAQVKEQARAAEAERGRFIKDPDGGVRLIADVSTDDLGEYLRSVGWKIPEEGP